MTYIDYILIFASWVAFYLYIVSTFKKHREMSNLIHSLTSALHNSNEKIEALVYEYSELQQNFIVKDKELLVSLTNNEVLKKQIETNNLKFKEDIKKSREDALNKSRSVMRGQASEHLAPYIIPNTNPKDYRFIGNPIDYICIEGLSDVIDNQSDKIISVKFIDIKTGKSNLSKTQRRIRDAINDNRVSFEVINLDNLIEDQDKHSKKD